MIHRKKDQKLNPRIEKKEKKLWPQIQK